jgi:hypothetical protein
MRNACLDIIGEIVNQIFQAGISIRRVFHPQVFHLDIGLDGNVARVRCLSVSACFVDEALARFGFSQFTHMFLINRPLRIRDE